jgi:hypothetical protein
VRRIAHGVVRCQDHHSTENRLGHECSVKWSLAINNALYRANVGIEGRRILE